MSGPHPLLDLFLAAAGGRFPPVDGGVTVVEPLPGGLECSVAFTGHAVVATALPADEVRAAGPDGYGASLAPDFLRLLAGPHGTVGVTDATLTAPGAGGPPRLGPLDAHDGHPRVLFARRIRRNVTVHGDERGLITLAEGLAGRLEISLELHHPDAPAAGGPRRGRGLLADALTLVPRGRPVFAAVAPGNARSLRAFLAAGFVPVGSEVIIAPGRG
ncbi:hypothetical protein OG233_22075 [Streptomyces sp. NBC_01218]|uniref:hypothetical protein n=1 Tax=unclassified Streptomyces TaxID=2593676 RepID=UPI0023BA39E6|nr:MULTISPECIES: hypothetical protein [unclassified Streptomyces]WEH42017.1 hypothetical protein PZB77_22360 [Streptomyces sp. AM 2-1-1]WSQ53616.1 hypothetical protein OG233_22075 [Streptomyces sp. NBC_01218]